jgi:hypothetical protein
MSDQVFQHHNLDGQHHSDGEKIAEDCDADLAAGRAIQINNPS